MPRRSTNDARLAAFGDAFNHVAVLMGGWSAEREVTLRSGKACADALESAGYQVTRIDAGRDLAEQLAALKPDGVLQRAARPLGRGRLRAGPARDARHPLHPFGRAGLGARHAQGARQEVMRAAGIPVRRGQRRDAPRGAAATTSCRGPTCSSRCRGLERRRLHRARGSRTSAAGAHDDPTGRFGDDLLAERYSGPRADLRRDGRPRARRHRDRAGRGAALLQLRGQVRQAARSTCCRRRSKPNVYELVQKLTLTAHKALGCRGVIRADFRYDDRTAARARWFAWKSIRSRA